MRDFPQSILRRRTAVIGRAVICGRSAHCYANQGGTADLSPLTVFSVMGFFVFKGVKYMMLKERWRGLN